MSDIKDFQELLIRIVESNEHVNTSQTNVDVCTLTWLLQAVGFNLDSLAFKEPAVNASAETIEVKLSCSASGMEAKLSRNVRRCTCPKQQETYMVHVSGQTASGTTRKGSSDLMPETSNQTGQVAKTLLQHLISLHLNETAPEPIKQDSLMPLSAAIKTVKSTASLLSLDEELSEALHTPRMVQAAHIRSLSTEQLSQHSEGVPERRVSVDSPSSRGAVPPLTELTRNSLTDPERKRPDFLSLTTHNRPAKKPILKKLGSSGTPDDAPVEAMDTSPGHSSESSSTDTPTIKSASEHTLQTPTAPPLDRDSPDGPPKKIHRDDSDDTTSSDPATVKTPVSYTLTTEASIKTVIDRNIQTPDEVTQSLPRDDPTPTPDEENNPLLPELPPDTRADDEPLRYIPRMTTSMSPRNCSVSSIDMASVLSSSPKLSHNENVIKSLQAARNYIDEALKYFTNNNNNNNGQKCPNLHFASPIQRSNTFSTITTHEKSKQRQSDNQEKLKGSARRSIGFNQPNIATPVQIVRTKSNLGLQDTPRPRIPVAQKTSSSANTSFSRPGMSKKSTVLAAKAPSLLERYKQQKVSTPKVDKKGSKL